jgi:hypothetical protein
MQKQILLFLFFLDLWVLIIFSFLLMARDNEYKLWQQNTTNIPTIKNKFM